MATVGNRAYSAIERKNKKKTYKRANKSHVKKARIVSFKNRLRAMRMRGDMQ